jgi:hypothetical protein
MYFAIVTLKLSDVRQNSGTRYFEKIRIVEGKPGFAHHWHWLWSAGSTSAEAGTITVSATSRRFPADVS